MLLSKLSIQLIFNFAILIFSHKSTKWNCENLLGGIQFLENCEVFRFSTSIFFPTSGKCRSCLAKWLCVVFTVHQKHQNQFGDCLLREKYIRYPNIFLIFPTNFIFSFFQWKLIVFSQLECVNGKFDRNWNSIFCWEIQIFKILQLLLATLIDELHFDSSMTQKVHKLVKEWKKWSF